MLLWWSVHNAQEDDDAFQMSKNTTKLLHYQKLQIKLKLNRKRDALKHISNNLNNLLHETLSKPVTCSRDREPLLSGFSGVSLLLFSSHHVFNYYTRHLWIVSDSPPKSGKGEEKNTNLHLYLCAVDLLSDGFNDANHNVLQAFSLWVVVKN